MERIENLKNTSDYSDDTSLNKGSELLKALECRANKFLGIVQVSKKSMLQLSKRMAVNLVGIKRAQNYFSEVLPLLNKKYREIRDLFGGELKSRILVVEKLKNRLEEGSFTLKRFKDTLNNLLQVTIYPELRGQLTPDIQQSEMTGTLYDWANVPQLMVLQQELMENQGLYEWGRKEIWGITSKFKDFCEEYHMFCKDMEYLEMYRDYDEKIRGQNAAMSEVDSIYYYLLNHLSRVKRLVDGHGGEELADLIDRDKLAAVKVAKILVFYSDIKNFFRESNEASKSLWGHFSGCQLLLHSSIQVMNDIKGLVKELIGIEKEVDQYCSGVPGKCDAYLQLRNSILTWERFITAYEELIKEIRRRREERHRQLRIVESLYEQLRRLSVHEEEQRAKFMEKYEKDFYLPLGWIDIGFLKEPPLKYDLTITPEETILPDLDGFLARTGEIGAESGNYANLRLAMPPEGGRACFDECACADIKSGKGSFSIDANNELDDSDFSVPEMDDTGVGLEYGRSLVGFAPLPAASKDERVSVSDMLTRFIMNEYQPEGATTTTTTIE